VLLDYCVYVLGSSNIKSYGLSWEYEKTVYSAKFSDGVLKDLYIIEQTTINNFNTYSREIDNATFSNKALYINEGFTKIDMEGNILVESRKVTSIKDLSQEELFILKESEFPYIDCIYGISEKPYGKAVEFFIPWEYMNAPAILNKL
jgi:hypothetical protein